VKDEYRGVRRRGFAVLAAVLVVVEDERGCDGRIVVERIGEEVFLWCGLLIWIAVEVLEGERAQFEEVGGDDVEVSLGLRLQGRWRWCG